MSFGSNETTTEETASYSPLPIPLPILGMKYGGEAARPLTWKDAPSVVRDARLLAILASVLFGLIGIAGIFVSISDSRRNTQSSPLLVAVFYALLAVANIWMSIAIKKRNPAAWRIQQVLSVLGLFGFPLGTLIHALLLSKWFKPETKAWFGMD